MRKFFLSVLSLAILASVVPSYVLAQGPNYITFKPGIYSPQSSDLEDFDTGFSGEIAFGHRFNPNFAAEMGVGYFESEANFSAAGQVAATSFSLQEEDSLGVVPITLSLKGIVPVDQWDFFGIAGIGAYWVDADADVRGTIGGASVSRSIGESDTVFGFHLGLGFHYNMTPTWFIGAEGKYLWTDDAEISDNVQGVPINLKFNMNGVIATAVLGFKF